MDKYKDFYGPESDSGIRIGIQSNRDIRILTVDQFSRGKRIRAIAHHITPDELRELSEALNGWADDLDREERGSQMLSLFTRR